ncbi:cortactin binding protein N-terminal like nausicaa isoform X2 [Rhodnius prolixus]|uniref:cortactin binding protein N-terminal like nausicaa isoform X2 n=1 Tax=Rhodnius prolixus TaxID=13249 RepID=UPI003D18A8AA
MASLGNIPKPVCTNNQGLDETEKEKCHYSQSEKTVSNTLKRNPKMELSKADLLKLLSYLEGELQARDIVIATLKVIEELIMEKKKHEHDTAQGDDITYGLEKERTKLKQDLEVERQAKKRLEKDLKKISDISDEDKNRQKQIVLLLLAERKKIVMKYIEERKRSTDLTQILTEEKSKINSMAEGLEEESKKSLQMEAEMEKQLAQFDTESQILRTSLMKEVKKVKELEAELEKLRSETAILEKQLAEAQGMRVLPTQPAVQQQFIHQSRLPSQGWVEGSTTLGSLAKVVQPTATVSSVPVSAPTTGVARSISPGHGLRAASYSPSIQPSKVEKRLTASRTGTASCTAARPAANGPSTPVTSSTTLTTTQPPCPVLVTDKRPSASTSGGSIGPSRGAPPPVPPNKPVVPPKKDSVLAVRRGTGVTLGGAVVGGPERIQEPLGVSTPAVHLVSPSDSYQNLPAASHQSPPGLV